MNQIKKIIVAGLIAVSAALPAKAETKVNFGYNALETAVITNADKDGNFPIRNRLLTNVDVEIGKLDFGYSGLNEMNNLDSKTYFGRHKALVGTTNLPIKGLVDIKTNKEGIFDAKYGIRIENPIPIKGTYGSLDLSANHDGKNISLFCGIPLGKGFSLEAFQDVTFPTKGKTNFYTELQLNKKLNKQVSLFGRMEMSNFDQNKTTYMVGTTINF